MTLSYERPADLSAALETLAAEGPAILPLAGGTDLVPSLRESKVDGRLLDLRSLEELHHLSWDEPGGGAFIGSLVTAADLISSPDIGAKLPTLAAAAASLGSPQIRNRASIGGNVMNASPAADMLLALVGLDAEAVLVSSSEERSIRVEDLVIAPGLTRRRPEELLRGFRIRQPAFTRGRFVKAGLRRSLACAVVNLSVLVTCDEEGSCLEASVALGAVGPVPFRAREAEEIVRRGPVDSTTWHAAAAAAAAACSPISDVRASADYRRHLVSVWLTRCLEELFESEDESNRGTGA